MLRFSSRHMFLTCLLSVLFVFTVDAQARPTPPIPLQPLITDCENVESPCLFGLTINPIDGYIDTLEPLLTAQGYSLSEEGTTGNYEMGGYEELYRIYTPPDDSSFCTVQVYYSSGDQHIIWVNMSECGTLYVEDVITHFGIPELMRLGATGGGSLIYGHDGFEVFFSSTLSRDALINRIVIIPPWEGGPYLNWHGYAPLWLYCFYEPYYESCWE